MPEIYENGFRFLISGSSTFKPTTFNMEFADMNVQSLVFFDGSRLLGVCR